MFVTQQYFSASNIRTPPATAALKLRAVATTAHRQPQDSDKEEVANLDVWKSPEYDAECMRSIQAAQADLLRKISNEDVVEEALQRRRLLKTRGLLRARSSQLTTTNLRIEKKKQEELYGIRCKYFKSYEDELFRTYCRVRQEHADCVKKRRELRSEVVEINEQLKRTETPSIAPTTDHLLRPKGKHKTEDLARYLCRKQSLRETLHRRELENKAAALFLARQLDCKQSLIESLDSQSQKLKKQLEMVKSTQVNHYFKLLTEGNDCRSEGLQ